MTSQPDDFDATRKIIEILQPFEDKDRERILRWSLEKLGSQVSVPNLGFVSPTDTSELRIVPQKTDIKSFVNEKKPKSDVHFVTTVAYYYRFEASGSERKDYINSSDVQEACRLVNRERIKKPIDTLNNAVKAGLLNRGTEAGSFVINTVGENLVAMTLPQTESKVQTVKQK
jgi:hypothetical protein